MKAQLQPDSPIRPQTKDLSIETLRGLAIILVVAGHAVGIDNLGGMKVPDDSLWRYLYASTQYLCLPLFTAISGWVYALRPVHAGEMAHFMLHKVGRLLLPMVCVGTLYFLIQYFTPGTNHSGELSDIWRIYIFPYTVYWYLPSLFLIFVFVLLLDTRGVCNTVRAWVGWMAFACALIFAEPLLSSRIPSVFSLWGAVCLLPSFLFGMGLNRFAAQLSTPRMRKIYLASFSVGFIIQQSVWFTGDPGLFRVWRLHLIIGMLGAAFLLTLTWRNRFLIWMGGLAYGVYLFHAFGTSGGRILLVRMGIDSSFTIFILSLSLGLWVPVVVELILRHSRLLRLMFLGETTQTEK